MRRIPIHTKLAAALTIPLLALVAVAIIEVIQAGREANEVRRQAAVVKAVTGPNGVFNALQDERNRGAANVVGFADSLSLPCDDNVQCRDETDRSLAKFKAQIETENDEVRKTYQPAFTALEGLDQVRSTVDTAPPPSLTENLALAAGIFATYSDMVDALLDANASVTLAIDNPELRQGADLGYMASRNVDLIAHTVERLLNFQVGDGDGLSGPQEVATIGGLFGLSERGYLNVINASTGDYAAAGQALQVDSDRTGYREIVPKYIETGEVNITELMQSVSIGRDESYYGFRNDVKAILEGKADDLVAESQQRARMFQALAGAAIVIAILATWLVSRSITRPLRALTRQATEMANHRLPDAVMDILDTPLGDDVTVPGIDPIHVQTRDEVADVADALNTVQDSALDLAVEQAVLRRNIADSFVNLGRRNQNLLGRQLDFITELEHNETDPDTLANLFRLDHLATRMRRNAESLLVLAGIDPPRKWAAPVRITDAIRAALGEVEDYQRVTVRAVEPATIVGSAAADLAHLLAELIENALIFSPPDQTVEIRGRTQPSGYTLAIIDSGLGMPPEELARANRRLAGAESFTIAPSKYLGHYVAGNLAARHNITVTLHNSPGHGITATIGVPVDVLTTQDHVLDPVPEVPTSLASLRPTTHEPAPFPLADPAAAAAHASQTASGLTKRTPRGSGAPPTQPAATPSDDLLQTLAGYTSRLQSQMTPAERAQSLPMIPGTPLSPATGTPALSHLPPFPVTPPSGYPALPANLPPPGSVPPGPPTPPPPLATRPPLTSRPPAPPPSLPPLTARPPTSMPPLEPASARYGGSGETPAVPSPPRPPLVGRPGADPGGAPTSGGLTRRIRGAQLPNTQTVNLRRGTSQPAMSPAARLTPAGGVPSTSGVDAPSDTWASQHTARDVYSFLSDFTAGVQRGLDEADPDGEPPGDAASD